MKRTSLWEISERVERVVKIVVVSRKRISDEGRDVAWNIATIAKGRYVVRSRGSPCER